MKENKKDLLIFNEIDVIALSLNYSLLGGLFFEFNYYSYIKRI